jgi:hypothetical protein
MTLPPNTIYVMSEDARIDWQHGIYPYDPSLDHSGPAPSQYSHYSVWNEERLRRAIVFRTTKAYSDWVLGAQISSRSEQNRAAKRTDADDPELNKLIGRKKRADKFPPQNDACEYLTATEVETRRGLAAIVQEQLERSRAAELRFESRDLMFNDGEGVVSTATSAADMGARRWMPPPPVAQPLGTRDDYEEAVWHSLQQSSAAEETDLATAIRRSLEPASPLRTTIAPTVVDITEVEVAGKRPRYDDVPLAAPSPRCAESGESRTLSLEDLRKARLARFDTAKLP